MRQRLLSYLTAACINLAIVSGTHAASLVNRPPIVRVRPSASRRGRFDRGELLPDDHVAVTAHRATPTSFSLN
ncbi:MAG: hypothetical protein LC793_18145 [Thermomicrobia bacterium]|nr:hypothetical protein [Thermomicrobia bacterium]